MQLLLNLDELKVVTRALEKCLAHSQAESLQNKRKTANRLLDKIIAHDLRLSSDELEDLVEILASCRVELKRRLAEEADERAKVVLGDQQIILEHATDKITEACAMA